MENRLYIIFLVLAMCISNGCAVKEAQKDGRDYSTTAVEDVPIAQVQGVSEPPVTESGVSPFEAQERITQTLPCEATKVRECVLNVLRERGEIVLTPEGPKEDVITGSRTISTKELKRIASLPTQERVRWKRGMYTLHLRLSPGPDKSTLLMLAVRILGYRENGMPLLRPSPWWPLPSKGVLEQEILAAISQCCQM